MRIVSWNCNGALRNKLDPLLKLDADIYIVQECEDPSQCKDSHYIAWAENFLWIGKSKHKGLGVFCKKDILLTPLEWEANGLESFLPCRINDTMTLLAVWTRQANSPTFGYIGQLWKYLQMHKAKLPTTQAILCGDLNSNACWDVWDRWWNHSDVVKELKQVGMESLYHLQTGSNKARKLSRRSACIARQIGLTILTTPSCRKTWFPHHNFQSANQMTGWNSAITCQ